MLLAMPRALFFTLLVACAAPFCAADSWPCPPPDVIYPCVCTVDSARKQTMDCSEVHSTSRLEEIFQTHFSFSDFKQLIIRPSNASTSLTELPSGVFGSVSFEEIDISGTRIHVVEEQALVNSHNTLMRLNLARNNIDSFPFETLDLFTLLYYFDISYNKLEGNMPNIVSDTLYNLDMSGNTGLQLTDTAFLGSIYIEELYLNGMQLGATTPPDVFKPLKVLTHLNLESNGITGELPENLINPQLDPLKTLSLSNNNITQIHRLSVTGMNVEGTVSFKNNKIEYLHRENWEGLISQLSKRDAIDIRGNPLVCGCDVKWLVFDRDMMAILHNETTCFAGDNLVDLPQNWFSDHCP